MKIIADINKVELRDFGPLISGAYRDKTIDVELSPEYDGLSVWAIFDRQSVKVEGGKCYTPTLERGTCSVGIYAVRLNDAKEIDLRYSPAPALINIEQGSYNSSLNSATAPTESEVEQIYALIDEAINAGMLKGDKGDPGTPGKDGAPGKDGIPGKDGAPGKDGYTPIKGVDYFDGAKGDKGEKGDQGEQGVKGDKGDKGEQGIQGLPGTTVYSELSDKPSINGVILEGNKILSDLGIVNYDDSDIKRLLENKQDKLSAEQLNNINAVPNKQDKLIAGTSMELIRDYTLREDKAAIGLRTYADGYLGVKDIAVEITVKGNSSGVSGKGINMHINGVQYWIAMLKNAFEKDENDTYCWHYLLTGFMTADGYFVLTNNLGNGDITAFTYTLHYAHSINTIFAPGNDFNPATTPYISLITLSTNDNAKGIGAGTRLRIWGTKYYG